MRTAADGLSLIELTIAIGLMLVVAAGVARVLAHVRGAAVAEPEAADMQQRLRVAADTLFADLLASGAGPDTGNQPGALTFAFAPVLPFRRGHTGGDPAGTYSADAITVLSVPTSAAHTTLAADLWPGSTMLQVVPESGCAAGISICRFAAGSTLLVYDADGSFDVFSLAAVDAASAMLPLDPRTVAAATFRKGSAVVQAQSHAYYVKRDPVTGISQLMRADGSANPDVPVVDHMVGLTFEYYGEPRAPAMLKAVSDPVGPWTTYGPKPPPLDTASTAYAAGENCAFQVDASRTMHVPRLADVSPDLALVKLTPAQLTDGPWCPDATSVNRWDADLLRVRAIVVTLRVEAALAALRGPAGALFSNGGLSRNSSRWLPDIERQFTVTPRNISGAR